MRYRLLLPIVVALIPFGARADERDDVLTRDLTLILRDRLAPTFSRVEAVTTLAKLGPRAAGAVPELMVQLDKLNDPETTPLREAIVKTLGSIGSPARVAIPTMTRHVGRDFDLDLAIRRSTNQILVSGDDDVLTLVQLLRSREDGQRLRAATSLGKLGPAARAAVPELAAVLADPAGDVRRTALAAIKSIQGTVATADAAGVFVLDLQSPEEDVRYQAAKNLGRLGRDARQAIHPLLPLLADPSPDVRRAAAEALGRIGG
ncbi:MAG TPA: HEAT repeat domain-containing protein [Gemmataceae bacterium]|nr:HEAT repeat domain-containing protein [Gemmataceae bacterium]